MVNLSPSRSSESGIESKPIGVRSLISVLIFVCILMNPASGIAELPTGGCMFTGEFQWKFQPLTLPGTGPEPTYHPYAVSFVGDGSGNTCLWYEGEPVKIIASGYADAVGRCSTELGAPVDYPWLENLYMSAAFTDPISSSPEVLEIRQAFPQRHLFPGAGPVPLVLQEGSFAGSGSLDTRIYGRCPPGGKGVAKASLILRPRFPL